MLFDLISYSDGSMYFTIHSNTGIPTYSADIIPFPVWPCWQAAATTTTNCCCYCCWNGDGSGNDSNPHRNNNKHSSIVILLLHNTLPH